MNKEKIIMTANLVGDLSEERNERIAELESERDMWKATAEAVVDFEKAQMRLRIAALEFTLKLALEALTTTDQFSYETWMRVVGDKAIEKCKEVLHG